MRIHSRTAITIGAIGLLVAESFAFGVGQRTVRKRR